MPPENPFDRALEELADGRPIDWAALEEQARNANELEIVKYLRLLEAVADVHSTTGQPLADGDTGPTESDPDEQASVETAKDPT